MANAFGRSGITFTWQPMPRLMAQNFNTLSVDVQTFRKPLKQAVTKVMAPSLRRNFEAGGRPERWQPLVDSTIRRKRQQGYTDRPLIASGRLSRRAGAFDLWSITDTDASIPGLPAAIAYGGYHQTGWTPASGGLGGLLDVEARPWMLFQEDDANEIEEIFFVWIEERIEANLRYGK